MGTDDIADRRIAAIIVAAGRGHRAGPGGAKQWRALAGRRVIDWALDAFLRRPDIDDIIVVLHPDDMAQFDPVVDTSARIFVVAGGTTRAASVQCGLAALGGKNVARVLIHDVARATVSGEIIDAVLAALDHSVGAAPALAITDALWVGRDGYVDGSQNRDALWRAQTPQGFHFDAIVAAHHANSAENGFNKDGENGAPDDVAVARRAGIEVAIVPGHEDNLKITYAADFARAERILMYKTKDT